MSDAADFFSGTPTHAAEPSSARVAKLRQDINSRAPLTHVPPPDFNATVAPPEKLADLQHPDAEHLLLGINFEGLREACELIGFPYRQYKDGFKMDGRKITYKREDHPEMAWLDEVYPTNYMSDKYKWARWYYPPSSSRSCSVAASAAAVLAAVHTAC